MSSYTHGGHEYRIDWIIIKSKCPEEYAAFEHSFLLFPEEDGYSLATFAQDAKYEQDLNKVAPKEIVQTYEKLIAAFKKETGLELCLGYLSDEDDQDEDHQGEYWVVLNAIEFTDDAKKLETYIHSTTYTYYA